MRTKVFEDKIKEAYSHGQPRDLMGMLVGLQCEVAELAELHHKAEWYGKTYDLNRIRSEAGDILNFLTIIIQQYNFTLEDIMQDNLYKLKGRGWIK